MRIVHEGCFSSELASIYWAHVHGTACLLIDGPLALQLPTPAARQQHLRNVGEAFADVMLATG
ncbi:MAG: hypothetical protein HIU89_17175 [Proteobacteria bacterium]|nr:hypothetical protein [Pseudomonadota bacterium]